MEQSEGIQISTVIDTAGGGRRCGAVATHAGRSGPTQRKQQNSTRICQEKNLSRTAGLCSASLGFVGDASCLQIRKLLRYAAKNWDADSAGSRTCHWRSDRAAITSRRIISVVHDCNQGTLDHLRRASTFSSLMTLSGIDKDCDFFTEPQGVCDALSLRNAGRYAAALACRWSDAAQKQSARNHAEQRNTARNEAVRCHDEDG